MSKFLIFTILFVHFFIKVESQNYFPVSSNTIDSIYNSLSLDEKLNLIIVTDNSKRLNNNISGKFSKQEDLKWICLDSIYKLCDFNEPFLSDVMVRSSFLNRQNRQQIDIAINILLKNHGNGYYFYLKSPYSLMFNTSNDKIGDFILEPYGQISLPYYYKGKLEMYTSNVYSLPSHILAPFNIKNKKYLDLKHLQYVNIKDSVYGNIQNLIKEYEHPCLESIFDFGGVIFSDDKKNDLASIKRVFDNQLLEPGILEKSCKKMILYQQLVKYQPVYENYFSNKDLIQHFINNIYASGNVLLENKGIVPVNNFNQRKMASLFIGSDKTTEFQKTISKYCQCDHFYLNKLSDSDDLVKIKEKMANYNTIFVAVNSDWMEEDIKKNLYTFLHQISTDADLILVHFGSGNSLASLPDKHPFKAILLSFDRSNFSQSIAAQTLFGGNAARGKLAKNINSHYAFGDGITTQKSRLGYIPSDGIAMRDTLSLIDQISYKAIRERATPGCEVLVVKDGNVIYEKAFGYYTYNKKKHVEIQDLYDIASVTKIVSSVPSVMKMVDEGKIKIKDSLSQHIPRLINSNKRGMVIGDMLVHQAGLPAWIPFYLKTIDKEKLHGENLYSRRYSSQYNIKLDKNLYLNKAVHYRSDIFKHSRSEKFDIKVTDNWYMNSDYIDSMKIQIDTSKVASNPEYRYSDLGYYYIKEIVESKYKQPLDLFVENNFYNRLGAYRTLYKPLDKYNKKEVIPTEDDKVWRQELLQGFVHDPGAAMLGGVGGHAGVFSNAEGLAKILQMYLYKGEYGGEHYIDSTTINLFTSVYKDGNRRGLGFDKPMLDLSKSGPTSKEVSPESFGHSGFTGTLVWADPKYNMIYIFLSNRINPNQYNKRLISTDVRTKIQSAIYRSLPEYWEKGIPQKN